MTTPTGDPNANAIKALTLPTTTTTDIPPSILNNNNNNNVRNSSTMTGDNEPPPMKRTISNPITNQNDINMNYTNYTTTFTSNENEPQLRNNNNTIKISSNENSNYNNNIISDRTPSPSKTPITLKQFSGYKAPREPLRTQDKLPRGTPSTPNEKITTTVPMNGIFYLYQSMEYLGTNIVVDKVTQPDISMAINHDIARQQEQKNYGEAVYKLVPSTTPNERIHYWFGISRKNSPNQQYLGEIIKQQPWDNKTLQIFFKIKNYAYFGAEKKSFYYKETKTARRNTIYWFRQLNYIQQQYILQQFNPPQLYIFQEPKDYYTWKTRLQEQFINTIYNVDNTIIKLEYDNLYRKREVKMMRFKKEKERKLRKLKQQQQQQQQQLHFQQMRQQQIQLQQQTHSYQPDITVEPGMKVTKTKVSQRIRDTKRNSNNNNKEKTQTLNNK
jgi:hypothetical protein